MCDQCAAGHYERCRYAARLERDITERLRKFDAHDPDDVLEEAAVKIERLRDLLRRCWPIIDGVGAGWLRAAWPDECKPDAQRETASVVPPAIPHEPVAWMSHAEGDDDPKTLWADKPGVEELCKYHGGYGNITLTPLYVAAPLREPPDAKPATVAPQAAENMKKTDPS